MKFKNIYNYFFILFFCLGLCACSTKIPFTKWADSGQISGTLWYMPNNNDEATTIPLLVRAEWENTPIQKGNLALVFLHGNLFAKCYYNNSELICESKSAMPNAKAIASNSAMLVSAAINDLQNKPMNLPQQYNVTKNNESTDEKTAIIYVFEHENIKVKFEIVEAIW